MKNNLGETDRLARILIGVVLLASGLAFWPIITLLAVYLIITSAFGFDPIMRFLNLDSRRMEKD